MKLTAELKIAIITELAEEGAKVADICSRYDLNKETVNQLRLAFKVHGLAGILKEREHTYTRDFKFEVVHFVKCSHDSVRNVSIKYNLPKATVRKWVIEYDKYGADSFAEERRGKKLPDSKPRGRKPEKPEPEIAESAELQQLRKRNKYLEMENEYLKKLNALVRERILREKKK